MLLPISTVQFKALLKEAMDEMDDAQFREFLKRVENEAKLRGYAANFELTHVARRSRTRKGGTSE